jgi:hypothetical protein
MGPVFKMPDEQFAACAGFDALTFVRFLGLCIRISAFISFFVLAVVLPVNWTSNGIPSLMRQQKAAGCADTEGAAGDALAVRFFSLSPCFTLLSQAPKSRAFVWSIRVWNI